MSKPSDIKLSFITPNYNDGKTIERMVDSVMDQDFKGIEQIIVDDGSTDDSKKVLKKLALKYKGRLKVIFLEKNGGACAARNIGAKEAKGKYLSFLPADAKLYPGVARIWIETLEENPTYDFLYGGYKFTDENYKEVMCYEADNFDPFFLKVNNYIDGSFPLKKELFDKMGGWDENIKSLQDWDLWLNAVLKHDAKGLFKREIFFETTLPHPGGLSDDSNRNWIERTRQIKDKYGIEQKRICVTTAGAQFHAKNIAKMLDADYLPMPSFKPHKYEMIYVVGFFGPVRQMLQNTRALRVLHWIGSDIMQLQQAPNDVKAQVIEWIDNNIDINLCEFEVTQKELSDIGIKARIVPFPPKTLYEPIGLPKKFTVAVYDPYHNKNFYYPDFIKSVAKKMKNVEWKFFGDPTLYGKKDNIEHMGQCNPEEMEKLIKESSAIVRLTPHDGLPLSVIEWITAGRNAITTVKMPFSNLIKFETKGKKIGKNKTTNLVKVNEDKLIEMINSLKEMGLNEKGSKYYREICDPEKFKKTLISYLDVDIKKWWDQVSDMWELVEASKENSDDIAKVIKEVKLSGAKNIIDLGCGTGRWSELLPVDDYTGLDFAGKLIERGREKYPDKKFVASDIKDYVPEKKYDLAFSFASLLHIKPENIKEYVESIKKIANKAIIVEPVMDANAASTDRYVHPIIIKKQKESDWIFNVKYTWIHDYPTLFEVEKIIPMSNNRNMFVIKL